MDFRKKTIFLLFTMVVIASAHAQNTTLQKNDFQISNFLQMIRSENVMERRKAASIIHNFNYSAAEIGQDLMNEIISLLIREENLMNETRKARGLVEGAIPSELFGGGEGGALYIANLCDISGKSGNLKILPLLMKYGVQGKELVGYGEEVANYCLEEIVKSTTKPLRVSYYISILGYWLQDKKVGYTASGELRRRIKTEIIEHALSELEYSIKLASVIALIKIDDVDITPVFEKVAASDPWHIEEGKEGVTDKMPSLEKRIIRYPLRELAKNEIAKRKK